MKIPPRGGILRHYYFQQIRSSEVFQAHVCLPENSDTSPCFQNSRSVEIAVVAIYLPVRVRTQTGRSRGRNRDRILFPCIDTDTDTDGDPD